MDIKQFQDSRNTKLAEFEKTYNLLKTEYSSNLLSAIKENDPNQQQQLISRILDLNSELSNELRDILNVLNQGSDSFDPKTLDDLTKDLIEYQKQYQHIQQTKDKLQTLKTIYTTNQQKLSEATMMYNIYLGTLIVLCLIVVFMVIRTGAGYDIVGAVSEFTAPLMPTQSLQ